MRRVGLTLAVFAMLHVTHAIQAQVAIRVVASSGQALPDNTGLTFHSVGRAVLNNAGEVAFTGVAGGAEIIWAGRPDSLTRAFESGTTGPGTDWPLGLFDRAVYNINHPGHITFINEGQNSTGVRSGLWSGPFGNVALVAQTGSTAPGGGAFSRFEAAQVSENGHLVFMATAVGAGRNVWGNIAGPLQLLRENTTFDDDQGSGPAALNNQGHAIYSTNHNTALAHSTPASPIGRAIARESQAAPGGGTYSTFNWHAEGRLHDVNNLGHMAMEAIRVVDGKPELTIVAGPPDDLRTVLRGGPVPGYPDHSFAHVYTIGINDRGQIAFSGDAFINEGPFTGDQGVWRIGSDGTVDLVAGRSAPLAPGGSRLVSPVLHDFNDQGQMLISGWTLRPGSTTPDDRALYLVDEQLNYHLLVRSGMNLTLPDGSVEIVQTFELHREGDVGQSPYFPAPRHGGPMLLSDAGEVAYTVRFADGTSAILVSTVPEPSAVPMLLLAGSLFLRPVRTRCRRH